MTGKGRAHSGFLSPDSKLVQFWQSLIAFCIFATVFIDTFLWAFDSRVVPLWIITYILDAAFIIHMATRFFVGYYENGILISDRPRIMSHYLKTTFLVDLFTALPLELIAYSPSLTIDGQFGFVVYMKYFAILRCNRLLRLYFVFSNFDTLESRLGSNTRRLMTAKYLTIASLLIHVMTCAWYALSCPGQHYGKVLTCSPDSWYQKFDIDPDWNWQTLSAMDSYLISMYWSTTTATSTGYGDIYAMNIREKWFAIISMLLGITVFFGVILGGMASHMTNLDTQRARYTHRLNAIKEYLDDVDIGKQKKDQVIGYYEYLWIRKKGETDDSLIDRLPITFHAEVSHSANKNILDKAPMFKSLIPGFLRMVSLEMKPALYLPHQIIYDHTELAHRMYYVQRGELEVLSSDDDYTPIMTLRCGALFGEINLVTSMPRTNSIRAAAHCDLVELDKSDLNNVLAHYPGVGHQLQEIAEGRITLARELENEVKPESPQKSHTTIDMSGTDRDFSDYPNHDPEDPGNFVAVNHPSCFTRLCRWLSSSWQDLRTYDWIFMPESTLIKCWEYIMLMATLGVSFLYPYAISFIANLHEEDPQTTSTVYTIMFILDILVFLDIVIKIRTAHVTPNGTYKDFKSIRVNYIQTWAFVFDVLAMLPLQIFSLMFTKGPIRTSFVYLLSLNRLLKFWRINHFFAKKQKDLGVNIGTLRFYKFAIYISLIIHWSACVWYMGLHIQGRNEEHAHEGHDETDPSKEYMNALYWTAATMTSTGYGDITASHKVPYIITLVVQNTGLLLFGYCLSTIAATLTNSDSSRVAFQERLFAVKQFMKDNHLENKIQGRVSNYLSMVFKKHKGEQTPGGQRLMHDMPIELQQDVAYQETKDLFAKVPLFQDCDEAFLRRLSLKMYMYMYSPGDAIVTRGDQGREMYFIKKGFCEVLSRDGKQVHCRITSGGYFGEIGALFGVCRTVSVVAASYCEILMLSRPDLDEVLEDFPLIAKQFKDISENKEYLEKLQEIFENREETSKIRNTKDLLADESMEVTSHKSVRTSMRTFKSTDKDYIEPFKKLGGFSRFLARSLMARAFLPDGFNVKYWEGCRVLVGMAIPIIVVMQVSFLHMCSHLWVISYVLEGICFLDMYLKFHYAYYNDIQILVSHPLATAKNYLRTYFITDLIACFPTEIIAVCILQSFTPEALHIYTLVRLNRLLQLVRMPLAFNFLEGDLKLDTGMVRQIKFFFYLGFFFHFLSCLWFFQACPPVLTTNPTASDTSGLILTHHHYCTNDSWTNHVDGFYEKSITEQWIVSLYWAAATGASVGYGDIHATPENYREIVISCLSMVSGIIFFGYIIASVAASLANADAQRARFQEKLKSINRYLQEQDVEKTLSSRINNFYNYLWLRTKGIDPDTLFDGLTLSLKGDVSVSLYAEMINKVPLFQGTDEGFQKMLAMCIKPVYYMAKEYVVRKYDVGENMFFIHRGGVDVVSEDGKVVFDSMMAGRFFGEISLIMSCPRTASIRAIGNCDMFVLTQKDLEGVLTHYPSIKEQIYKVAEERFSAVRQRSQAKLAATNAQNTNNNGKGIEVIDLVSEDEPGKNTNNNAPTIIAEKDLEVVVTQSPSLWHTLLERNRFVLAPSSRLLRFLSDITCALIFLTTLTIIFQTAYQYESIWILVFSYVSELVFIYEIYIKFHVSCADEYGDLEMDFGKVYRLYLKNPMGFPVDFVATLPFEVVAVCFPAHLRFAAFSYLRLTRLIRLIRLNQFFANWEKELDINMLTVRLVKVLVTVTMIIHICASIWYMTACPLGQCKPGTWGEKQGYLDGLNIVSTSERLTDSIYWCVATLTSTGYGDIHAHSNIEMLFASFAMILGQLLVGSVLGNMASTLANRDTMRVAFEKSLQSLKDTMTDYKLNYSLMDEVVDYFNYVWMRNRGVDQHTLFDDSPFCLQTELFMHVNGHHLRSLPIFADVDDACFRAISLCLTQRLLRPGDDIVRQGDVGNEMYFIHRGTVEVMEENNPDAVDYLLKENDYFDDIHLLYDLPRSKTFRAVTHVDVLTLSMDDLNKVFEHFPLMAEKIKAAGKELYGNRAH